MGVFSGNGMKASQHFYRLLGQGIRMLLALFHPLGRDFPKRLF